jgi:hypothetical protein
MTSYSCRLMSHSGRLSRESGASAAPSGGASTSSRPRRGANASRLGCGCAPTASSWTRSHNSRSRQRTGTSGRGRGESCHGQGAPRLTSCSDPKPDSPPRGPCSAGLKWQGTSPQGFSVAGRKPGGRFLHRRWAFRDDGCDLLRDFGSDFHPGRSFVDPVVTVGSATTGSVRMADVALGARSRPPL